MAYGYPLAGDLARLGLAPIGTMAQDWRLTKRSRSMSLQVLSHSEH
jgi:hypothetical protein